MDKLPMCRICLVQNVHMYVVSNKNLQELYEKLTDIPFVTDDSRPILTCFVCCAQLKKCYRLLTKCLEAEEQFTQIMNGIYEPKPLINHNILELFHGFGTSPIQSISIVENYETESIAVKEESKALMLKKNVKEEPVCDDVIKPKEEHSSDDDAFEDLKPVNLYDNYLDKEDIQRQSHHSESNSEDDVPLMELKTPAIEEQEVPGNKQKPKTTNNAATEMTHNLLPANSKKLYEKTYQAFIAWKRQKKVTSFSENVLMAYFQELSGKFKCSSLWSKYSMLKSTLSIYNEVDVSKYSKLIGFLKSKSQGYIGKKSKTFSPEQLNKFINEAPGRKHLLTKIALIFGIVGACRRHELYNIQFQDVEVYKNTILVTLRDKKNRKERSFSITGKYFDLCKEYIALRPNSCKNPGFFLNYHFGKGTQQRVGINKFGTLGRTIADYLQLPNSEQYTGHCFRRTSATLLVDADGDITTLKRRGGWKSSAVAEGYIDESTTNKSIVSNSILNSSAST